MNTLHKCSDCSFAATSNEGLVGHILNNHVRTPTLERRVLLPDGTIVEVMA